MKYLVTLLLFCLVLTCLKVEATTTIYPAVYIEADTIVGSTSARTTSYQYTQEVTAAVTDSQYTIYLLPYDLHIEGDLIYVDIDFHLLLKGSATSEIIWRIEGQNADETIWQPIDKLFTVTSSNDVMEWETSEATVSVDTGDGVYTGGELAAAMQTAIRAATTLVITSATVVYSSTTHKFTFDGVTLPISCAYANSDMATTIGFDRDLSAATEQTSRFAVPSEYETNVGTSWIHRRIEGYINLYDGILDEVPFDLRVVFECNEGATGKGKLSSITNIKALFKETE